MCLEDILLEMRDQLAQSRAIETNLAKPLFDSLLRVALGNYSADLDHSEEKTEMVSNNINTVTKHTQCGLRGLLTCVKIFLDWACKCYLL